MADTRPTSKACTRCMRNLPLEEFYRKRNSREMKCRTCVQELRRVRSAAKPAPPCKVDGCDSPVKARGKCDLHYRRELKQVNPTPAPSNSCACGCGGLTRSTYMTGHHRKVKGAKPPVPAKPVDQRIRESSTVTETGCWEWNLATDKDGYGSIKVAGRTRYAARTSYEVFIDDVPEGMVVHQKCNNRGCVNPDHLEAITHVEQVARGASDPLKNFASYYERRRAATHCPNGHPWDEENTRRNEVQRVCRACLRERMEQRRADDGFRENERNRNRELYAENREAITARKRAWREANREQINAAVRKRNKARYEQLKSEGICIRVGCGEPVSSEVLCEKHRMEQAWKNWGLKYEVPASYAERGLDTCWMCGEGFEGDEPLWHDHLIPRSLGGPDAAWNLAPSHRICNIVRSNTPLNITIQTAVHWERATADFPDEYWGYLAPPVA